MSYAMDGPDRSGTGNGQNTSPGPQMRATREIVQLVATLVGATFLLVGILGFVPGITTHVGDLGFAGHHSGAKLIGVFQVSVLHNLVHLLFGVAGLLLARAATTAKLYLIGGGVVYLVVWVYGLVVDQDSGANFVPLNTADNWLHLALGLGMVLLGLVLPRHEARDTAA